ncbi:MAG TPA: 30S ribosomal protein S4 [Desulfomonilaceae bacterium]|nr:30S ribosomal protein S4 [Desulfomonilaceae bacterium]
MARYRDSVCRFCRREGTKLFLKGDRCFSDKCAVERRNYPPGQHAQSRPKPTDYGTQLREKQKVRRIYGVLEKQFRKYARVAEKKKGVTGENLLLLLETRLDNIVYRIGFASSRVQARQLVNHGHVLVNGRKVTVASFQVKPGAVVEIKGESRSIGNIEESLKTTIRRGVPTWLDVEADNFKGTMKEVPTREELPPNIREQLIVEYYSR